MVSAMASCAGGPGFDPRQRRGKFVGPNTLPFVSFTVRCPSDRNVNRRSPKSGNPAGNLKII